MVVIFLLAFLAACSCGLSEVVEKSVVLAEDLNIHIKNGKTYFYLYNKENGGVLRGTFGEGLGSPEVCGDGTVSCLQYQTETRLTAVKVEQCYHINWTSTSNIAIRDCLVYGEDNWYGGPENVYQIWPFNKMTFKEFSYVTKQDQNQAIAEPYWVTSSGYYVYVDKTTPLFIDSNNMQDNGLCLIANQVPPYLPRGGTSLRYKICVYSDTKKAHMNAVNKDLHRPTGIPDHRMVQHPIWSTWVRFKTDVNESAVMGFAKEIVSNGFNNSQIEIDDKWETCYGSAQFDQARFPDMRKFSSDLNEMGFRITLWNHPFVNVDCEIFQTLKEKGYLVKNVNGSVVSTWWDGEGGVVDFTNGEAAKWFVNRHRSLMRYNKINSLKLDAGESSWLPQIPQENARIDDQPDAFSAAYVRAVAGFGRMVEVRSGHLTQDLPIFVRMIDKDSKWTFENGLPTLLTTLFQMNLNGYTLVLPDMVGGNAYGTDVVTKELFIRWLQATTFMPAIQFSVAPWDFDEETVEISKKYTALHYAYSDKIIDQMRKCVWTGDPVNTPIWWVAPKDLEAHNVWSEFMLGEDILVAPVLEKGAVSRDIYLPRGQWRDEADPSHKVYRGMRWLRNYSAPLDTLPFFIRVCNNCSEDDVL